MKGGYKDAYFMQLISFVRKFKGMGSPTIDDEGCSIAINNDFSQWETKGITYNKYVGGCKPRNHPAYDKIGKYENYTGRNEFKTLKVAADNENLYFFAECNKDITTPVDSAWMNLYIKIPEDGENSWEGYQYLINRRRNEHFATIEKCAKNGEFAWEECGEAEYFTCENKIHFKIPKSTLGISGNEFSVEFKWSDNMQTNDIMDFYVNGDSAPMGRLNYTYIFKK
jgi:hypothetical protein